VAGRAEVCLEALEDEVRRGSVEVCEIGVEGGGRLSDRGEREQAKGRKSRTTNFAIH
jgi:hypothetical protein